MVHFKVLIYVLNFYDDFCGEHQNCNAFYVRGELHFSEQSQIGL